ncbi:MAG: hypothetical protein LBH70_00460 [Spirochaetaceae bacterium]|jgi:hypothetical protein|nr:hypothetical protein [Spirochaetaceae bacterium]
MAKVSDQERRFYLEKIGPYQAMITAILKQEKEQALLIQQDPANAPFKRLALVEDMLTLTSYYIVVNGVSISVLKAKNDEALNDARKSLYKSIIYLEQVVTNLVDAGFSEYEDKAAAIASLDSLQRYSLVRKMGLAIHLLENAYGDNSKWRWAFVELEGRYAAAAKNILDMKNIIVNTTPRSQHYESAVYHLRLVRRLLSQAADRYRERYELSTSRIDDFHQGINFLGALKRVLMITGGREEVEVVQKKIDAWSAKLEMDLRKQQEIPQRKE